jgi:hypothetical protein
MKCLPSSIGVRPQIANRYMVSDTSHRLLLATALLLFISGCTSVKKGVSGTENANMPVFADHTVALFGVHEFEFHVQDAVLTREFVDDQYPDIRRLNALITVADKLRDRVIGYSLVLARIGRLPLEAPDKVAALADSIEEETDIVRLESIGVSPELREEVIEAIRLQENYLAALRAAQPFVDALGAGFENLLSEIEDDALVDAVSAISDRIDAKHARLIEYQNQTDARQQDLLFGLTLLQKYKAGDSQAMDELIASGILIDGPAASSSPDAKEVRDIRQYLVDELGAIAEVNGYIQPEIDQLNATRRELRQLEVSVIESLGIARVQMLTWNRAYQFMASGVKSPGEWFKFGSSTSRMFQGQL